MKRTIILLLLALLAVPYHSAIQANPWEQAISSVEQQLVLIEYYELISTAESIEAKERVKRYLTGLLVNNDGLIMTSSAIFRASLEFSAATALFNRPPKPTEIRVKFGSGDFLPADFLGKDDDQNLAFIKLNNKVDVPPLRFGPVAELRLGQKVLVLQHLPERYDFELLASERMINAVLDKPKKRYLIENNLKGFSGFGLVLDDRGRAVGVLQAETPAQQRFGFHGDQAERPAEVVLYSSFKNLIEQPPLFLEKKTSRKKWLGIYMQPFTRDLARYFGSPQVRGVLINTVLRDSPAERAGLRSGDVVTALNGQALFAEKNSDLDIFRNLIRQQKETLARFEIFRDGAIHTIDVELGETPISQFLAEEISDAALGFSVKELTQDIIMAKQLDPDADGVWVSRVERAGWADLAGLQIGDLILRVNDQPVTDLASVRDGLNSIRRQKPDYVSLFVKRGAGRRFLFIKTNYEK